MISAFIDRWLTDTMKNRPRPKTYESYSYLIKSHINPSIGFLKLTELRPHHLQNVYSQKIEAGLSPRTVYYIHSVIHHALEQAMKWGLVVRNVADLVDAPKPKRKTPQVFSIEQTKVFFSAITSDRWKAIYYLAIGCGFREGEILGLYFEDVDLDKGVIFVQRAVQSLSGQGLVITEPKTERGKRPVTIPDFALTVLRDFAESQNRKQGLIFATSSGKPISPRNLIRNFHQTLERAGLPQLPFHSLRHLSATLLLMAGVDPKVVQERLGHSSIVLTLETYSHVIPSMQEEAGRKLNDLMQ